METDEELTERARAGDQRAVGELYRRHLPAARATAQYLLHSRQDVDDVVSEAFAGVLSAFRSGHGPRDNFRCYLMACVRNACHVRRKPVVLLGGEQLEGQIDGRRDGQTAGRPGGTSSLAQVALEDPEKFVEADTVARAFAALSPRWQQALWLSEVEQRPPAEVGEAMHTAANATAALTHRARQAFASAYLSEHVAVATSAECAAFASRLGAYVRQSLRDTDRRSVEAHLDECAGCRRAVEELSDINTSLRTLQAPGAGVGVGAAALAASAAGGTAAVGGVWGALAGVGVLAKVAAVALVAIPTIAFGLAARDDSARPSSLRGAPTTSIAADPAPAPGESNGSGATPAPVGAAPIAAAADVSGGGSARQQPWTGALPGVPGLGVVASMLDIHVAPAPESGDGVAVGGATVGGVTVGGATVGGVAVGGVAAGPVTVAGVSTGGVSTGGVSTGDVGLGGVTLGGVTAPGILVPGVSVPAITVPGLAIPGIGIPGVSVPALTLPPVQVPAVSVPPLQLPVLSTPVITLPGELLPQLTIPSVTVSVPAIELPAVSVPPVNVPAVSVPAISLPPITLPSISLPPVTIPVITVPVIHL